MTCGCHSERVVILSAAKNLRLLNIATAMRKHVIPTPDEETQHRRPGVGRGPSSLFRRRINLDPGLRRDDQEQIPCRRIQLRLLGMT